MKKRIDKIVGGHKSKICGWELFILFFPEYSESESEKIHYPQNFTIYDTSDSKSLIRSIIKELNLDKDIYKVGTIQNRISSLKNNFITPKDITTILNLHSNRPKGPRELSLEESIIYMYKDALNLE